MQGRKGEFRELFESVRKQGFIRAYVDGELIEVASPPKLNRRQNHTISVVVDRLVVRRRRSRPARRLDRDGAQARRRRRRSRATPTRERVEMFSERYGCPTLRHLAARARAAPLLLQLAVRRLPDVRRTRHAASRERSSSSSASPQISILEGVVLPWGEPSGYLRKIVLPALARQLKFDLNAPWGELPKSRARRDPPRRRSATAGSKKASTRRRVGGRARATSSDGTTSRSPTRSAWSCRSS